jgi:hypothetical protein
MCLMMWTADKIASLTLDEIKSLRANALRLNTLEVVQRCNEELASRAPPKKVKAKATGVRRNGQPVLGFHFVCPEERRMCS